MFNHDIQLNSDGASDKVRIRDRTASTEYAACCRVQLRLMVYQCANNHER